MSDRWRPTPPPAAAQIADGTAVPQQHTVRHGTPRPDPGPYGRTGLPGYGPPTFYHQWPGPAYRPHHIGHNHPSTAANPRSYDPYAPNGGHGAASEPPAEYFLPALVGAVGGIAGRAAATEAGAGAIGRAAGGFAGRQAAGSMFPSDGGEQREDYGTGYSESYGDPMLQLRDILMQAVELIDHIYGGRAGGV